MRDRYRKRQPQKHRQSAQNRLEYNQAEGDHRDASRARAAFAPERPNHQRQHH